MHAYTSLGVRRKYKIKKLTSLSILCLPLDMVNNAYSFPLDVVKSNNAYFYLFRAQERKYKMKLLKSSLVKVFSSFNILFNTVLGMFA